MSRQSAGILLFRRGGNGLEVLLVHPGGPFWTKKDDGAWSIPKGEFAERDEPLTAAKREFEEELGQTVEGDFVKLEPIRQKGGKTVHAWAVEGDCNVDDIISNTFELEWPPRSGRIQEFPEVDRAEWFDLESARTKINARQVGLLDQLRELDGQ